MHRYNTGIKSCLSTTVTNLVENKHINTSCKLLNNRLAPQVQIVNPKFNVHCGLVCTVNIADFIRVNKDSIYLSRLNNFSADINVITNVEWIID